MVHGSALFGICGSTVSTVSTLPGIDLFGFVSSNLLIFQLFYHFNE